MAEQDPREVARKRGLSVEQVDRLQQRRGLTTDAIASIGERTLQRLLLRLEHPNFARSRQQFRLLQERDEYGVIPPDGLERALSRLDALRARPGGGARIAGVPTGRVVAPRALGMTAGLSPGHTGWTALGPGNIGGRIRSIVVHPTVPATMWAGSVGGGVWRTDDAGASWEPVNDLMANLAVCSMVMDPTNANVMYAGTGEGFFNVDALRGAGIFQTTDGDNWIQLASTTGPDFTAVNRLAISNDGAVLFAATRTGLFRSSDAARATWTRVVNAPMADVDCDPSDPARVVAGALDTGKAFFSTDGGVTWSIATTNGSPGARVELTYAATDSAIVYASVDAGSGEIWRSTDGGQSYSRRSAQTADGFASNFLGEQGWYDNVIWAGDPANSDLVIVGGVDLWRSTNGGNTLVDISTWWSPNSVHADHHCIVTHPQFGVGANRSVFLGNDGGVYTTPDISTAGNDVNLPRNFGWQRIINSLAVTQFYGAAGNGSGTIIGGAQDNGTLRFTPATGASGWTEMFGGDGGWCAADPTDAGVMYGEYVNLNIHRSTDGGQTADFISGQFWDGNSWEWKPVPFRISDARSGNALFIAPFVLDPTNADRILGGGSSLWRTNTAKAPNTNSTGPTWTPIKPGVGVEISAIAVSPTNADVIWVGHAHRQGIANSGNVYRTTNGTAATPSWQKMDDNPGPLPNRFCTRITIDPVDGDVVYVMFGGYSKGNVWKTENGGTTWTNIGAALPEAPVRTLAIHPRRQEFLYIGTEVGVFASEDAGVTWSPTNEGPTTCSVDELFWMGETLVCATHGRGLFQIDLSGV